MNKEKMYHVGIKNLENKRKENFILATDRENPQRITGADNLAPKYQVGRMEYGDFTNHSVWAQSDWSEGGGKKYFEAYQDGYNVYPFSKKYFSKTGIRTNSFPGELQLGPVSRLMKNFPEEHGELAHIATYNKEIFVGINLKDKSKIYKTSDDGESWVLVFDSDDITNDSSKNSIHVSGRAFIKTMFIADIDNIDKNYKGRANPSTGQVIPLGTWDEWWDKRRHNEASNTAIYIQLCSLDNVSCSILRIPIDTINLDLNVYGYVTANPNKKAIITKIYNDFNTEYDGTTLGLDYGFGAEATKKYIGISMDSADVDKFFVGQSITISLVSDPDTWVERRILAKGSNFLILDDRTGSSNGSALKIKLLNKNIAIEVDSPLDPFIFSHDFQGNNRASDSPHNFNIINNRNKKIVSVLYSGSSNGHNHANVTKDVISSNASSYRNKSIHEGSSSNYKFGIEYTGGTLYTKTVNIDRKNYFILDYTPSNLSEEFKEGDTISYSGIIEVGTTLRSRLIGYYNRKDTLKRDADLFHSDKNTYKFNNPGDYINSGSETLWFKTDELVTLLYNHDKTRDLFLATKSSTSKNCSIVVVDDTSTGTVQPLLSLGEDEISGFVKHNENLYIATNDKGRIYRWDGNTYEVIERFDLDPSTNSVDISNVEIFGDLILFVDNNKGSIISYNPSEDMWDDLTAPEYIREEGDKIISLAEFNGVLLFGTNKSNNLLWTFDNDIVEGGGNLVASWYSADMPAVDKKGLYVQILTQKFQESDAKIRFAVQIDYDDKWYYLSKERGQLAVSEANELHELKYSDYKSSRAFYLYFPYNFPKFKTIRYRIEIFSGKYKTLIGSFRKYNPVVNNIDLFYILTDPKEVVFTYNFMLENRMQIGSYGDNEIGTHRDKLDFLLDIWNNDTMVEITHVDGKKYTCIPFKPMHLQGGGMSVIYQNISPSRKDLDQLSYLVTMMFKNINKIDNFGK